MEISFKKDSENKNSKTSQFVDKLVAYFKNFDNNFYFFLFLCAMGIVFFIDSLLTNQCTTLFGGDYTSQQLSFYTNGYDDWWHFFKTGEFVFFDTNTYLGASNLSANSFYYLYDPFFFPILLCPREFIAQGMVFLTIFKIATAGMFFMWYMRYMGASKNASRIAAFAYAFSGWMAWFLWFNHMTEITIIFPLMMLGVEKALKEKKPWLLMIGTMLMGITNYFFLMGMGLAAFFYAMFRFFQRLRFNSAKENWKILGVGFIGFATGLLLCMFAVLPSVISSLDAPRASNSDYLNTLISSLKAKDFKTFFSYIFEWKNTSFGGPAEFRHFYPIINFFFPCASCRGTPLTQYGNESYDNVATNIYCFVPMMLYFIPAFIKDIRKKKWSVIIATVLFLVALETPFCYYLFFGFTAPYGRWELFFVFAYIAYCGLHIDEAKEDPNWTKILSYIVVIALIIFAGWSAQHLIDKYEDFVQRSPYITATGATLIMCFYVSVVFASMLMIKKPEKIFSWNMVFIALEVAVMGFLTIEGHWCGSFIDANNGLDYNNDLYQLNQRIKKVDNSYYRCWSYLQNESGRNDGMRNDYNGLGCFHSLYNFNLNNFLNWTRIQDGSTWYGSGSWAGSYVWKNADIDKFLGVKYYMIQKNSPQWYWMYNDYDQASNSYISTDNGDLYQYNVPLDFVHVEGDYNSDRFAVFVDTKPMNFAVAFNNIYSYQLAENAKEESLYDEFSFYSASSVLRNDEMLLEAALLDVDSANELVAKYPNLTVAPNLDNRSMYKTQSMNVKATVYDLNTGSDGWRYSVNTFFESNAKSWFENTHAMTATRLINIDDGFFQEVSNTEVDNQFWGRYATVLTPHSGSWSEFYDEKGYAVYVPYSYSDDYGADIYLISDDGKIITWDRHQDDKYSCGGEKYRGFYVHGEMDAQGNVTKAAPKLAKIVIAQRYKTTVSKYSLSRIYTETYTKQQERMAHIYENAPFDVEYSTNKFNFKTNNSENLIMVTQMPWENGWRLKAKLSDGTTKNVELFKAQGGYTSFVCEKGLTEYTLDFYPANLMKGKILSAVGSFLFVSSFYVYLYMNNEYKKKEHILEEYVL